jgi:hypothetical protein
MKKLDHTPPTGSCELRSHYWLTHFRENLARTPKINWNRESELDLQEDARLIRSIQGWQLGETSDGAHLRQATRGFLDQCPHEDVERRTYIEAVKLFIEEEQKHGENLGRYLDKVGAERIKFDLGDTGFRLVRSLFSNMEIWSASVLMVETMAQIYYKALRDSERCELLGEICADILADEVHHLRFQIERVRTYYAGRSMIGRAATRLVYKSIYTVIVSAVWFAHRHALRQGELTLFKFWSASWRKFLGHWRLIGKLQSASGESPREMATSEPTPTSP